MRRNPSQARSRQTVERIVAAGRTVLADEGYDAFSTNRVAAAAGVSPGSLYQYFADKEAILAVVIDRYWDEIAEQVAASLSDRIGPEPLGPTTLRAMADALLRALEGDPALLRVLVQELPQSANRDRRAALERRVRDLISTYLSARPNATRRPDVALAAWVIVVAVENIALRWTLDRPAFERDRVLDEITTMVTAYLVA
ncbi:TetR/AcrR family transcriptional regulator [Nocardioides sp. GY 10113]|uniref:TetR/AcrR family transcriptional regulator n=1 Tax=Nocardioides sp. GY 10113 TaxID=2569761 RepID=UPI0010A8B77B|nr:TetR/AcrR family transcriptional regulator [Nocardioides sp. GY 10113]TIC83254.1 TetR/AcrR family transcriptional regulator [Nocardioides sp. GY 10113]